MVQVINELSENKQTIYWPHHCAGDHTPNSCQTEATQGKSAWIQGQVPRQGGIFSKILIPNNLRERKRVAHLKPSG